MEEPLRYANIVVELCTAAFCLAGVISVRAFAQAPRRQRVALAACFISCAAMALGDALAGTLAGAAGDVTRQAVLAGNTVSFAACCALVAAFTVYVKTCIEPPPHNFVV